jgi:hypothetical protein
MSAYGTKKPGSDMAIQLGFPSIFSEAVAHNPQAYTNQGYADDSSSDDGSGSGSDSDTNQHPLPAGNHLQDNYHAQKMRDARAMAMAGVQARKNSDYRHSHSHANYFRIPKAVLGQRKFANPSLGNQADIYAARPNQFLTGGGDLCSLRGGVLRTAEGQAYGMKLLRNRAHQFDVIDQNKVQFLASQPTQEDTEVQQGLPEQPGTKAMLELNALLQQIADSVYAGAEAVSRFALADMSQALRLLFRIASIANAEELDDLLTTFANLRQAIPNLEKEATAAEESNRGKFKPAVRTMIQLIRKGYLYVERMLGAVNRSPKDRKRLSATLAKNFTKFGDLAELEGADERELAANAPRGVDGDDFDEEEDEDDDGGDEGPPPLGGDDNQEEGQGDEEGSDDEGGEEAEEEEEADQGFLGEAELYDAEVELAYLRRLKPGYVRAYAKLVGIPNAIGKQKAPLLAQIEALPPHRRAIVVIPNPYAPPGSKPRSVILGLPEEVMAGNPEGSKNLKTYTKKALDERLAEVGELLGQGRARGGASRPSQRPRPSRNSVFTRPGESSEYTEQMDSLRQAGLRNIAYSRDERNVFAKKSGAYLGEPLPKGGDAVEEPESYKYPVLKEGGRKFTKAKLREAPAPVFGGNASTATFGDGLKARLNGGIPVGFPDQSKSNIYNGVPYAGGKKKKPVETSNDIVRRNNELAAQRRRAMEAMERARKQGRGKVETKPFKAPTQFSRADLPKTRDGFVALAAELKGQGHNIRVNSGSSLANIRQNFIRRLKL